MTAIFQTETAKTFEILLIQPPVRDFYLTRKRTIPYGLAAIAAPLIDHGFTVRIIDMLSTDKKKAIDLPKEMDYLHPFFGKPDISPFSLFHQFHYFGYSHEHLRNELKRSAPFLIGISSLFTAYSDEALTIARIAKEIHPQGAIVMGGHHPTALPHDVICHDVVDYVIRGEGETSLLALALCLKKGQTPGNIPGLLYKKKEGEIHMSEPVLTEDLNTLPLPASQLINSNYYQRGKGGSITIMTGRGCPMTCAYCAMGDLFRHYRKRSVANVMEELSREVSKKNARFIDFEDENLSLDRKWFISLLKEMIERFDAYPLELRAMNGLFPPSLDEEVISLMEKAGFKTLNLSVGSTDPEQLRRFRRPDVRYALETILEICDTIGLETVCYIIVGAPGQSAESSLRDLLYLYRKNTISGVSVYYPAPGSHDYSVLERSGKLPATFSLMRATAIPIDDTTPRLEAVTLLRLSRIMNFLKALKKKGEPPPLPEPFDSGSLSPGMPRTEIGKRLLAGFFYDGKIRGMTPDGLLYDHRVSPNLIQGFTDLFSGKRSILRSSLMADGSDDH